MHAARRRDDDNAVKFALVAAQEWCNNVPAIYEKNDPTPDTTLNASYNNNNNNGVKVLAALQWYRCWLHCHVNIQFHDASPCLFISQSSVYCTSIDFWHEWNVPLLAKYCIMYKYCYIEKIYTHLVRFWWRWRFNNVSNLTLQIFTATWYKFYSAVRSI